MPRICCVSSCRSGHSGSPESSLHKFPADEVLREAWLQKCAGLIPDNQLANINRLILCSQHFTEDDFERDLKSELLGCASRRRLKKSAVPSVNLLGGNFQLYMNTEFLKKDGVQIQMKENVLIVVPAEESVVRIKEEPVDDDCIELDSSSLLDDETADKTSGESSFYHLENKIVAESSRQASSLHVDSIQIKVEDDDDISSLDTGTSLVVDTSTHHQNKNATTRQSALPDSTPRSKSRNELWQIALPDSTPRSTPREGLSSLPAIQAWPGNYGFSVSFQLQEQFSKAVSWTYSSMKDKLYVGKDEPCPINFATDCPMPKGQIYIRAMALFSTSEHVTDIVHRCYNHSSEDSRKGLPEAEHLIRCMFNTAKYEVDPVTQRHSVVVPFENPPVGQHFSTYLYKFTCFGSCAGGPNRRPLMVIFTLERGNEVIGRRKVDVKICACPGRDRKTDEQGYPSTPAVKRKETSEFSDLSETFGFLKTVTYPTSKKSKISTNKDGCYTITVKDAECFEFLKQMKLFYEMCRTMKILPPDVKKKYFELNHRNDSTDETH